MGQVGMVRDKFKRSGEVETGWSKTERCALSWNGVSNLERGRANWKWEGQVETVWVKLERDGTIRNGVGQVGTGWDISEKSAPHTSPPFEANFKFLDKGLDSKLKI